MKLDFIFCIVAALGLHAGVLALKLPSSAPAVSEVEIGLEAPGESAGDPSAESPASQEMPAPASERPAPLDAPPSPREETPPSPPLETPPPLKPEEPPLPTPTDNRSEDAPPAPPAASPSPLSPNKAAHRPPAPRSASKGTRANQQSNGGSGHASSTARYLFRAPLQYPAAALAARAGGHVILSVDINENGRAVGASVQQSSGRPDLDASAIECAMNSRYEPNRVNGLPQPCRVQAPFHFKPR